MVKKIDICLSPALFHYHQYPQYETIVVVDIFRATTTICTALYHEAQLVKTVADIEVAKQYIGTEYLLAAERNTQQCDFAQLGNSPLDYTPSRVKGKKIVLTTTNGTQAINMAKEKKPQILIGAFSNIDTLKQYLIEQHKNTLILCSGWHSTIASEDTLMAGMLAQKIIESGKFITQKDATNIAIQLYSIAQPNLTKHLQETEHFNRLSTNKLTADIAYCLTQNSTPIIPKYDYTKDYFTVD